mmetsp:Transcript_4904/g.9353  ORF Transcript_4904/g.9353 Transcript_4904/m.9353 type:complete len:377 (-) Transcript_4904:723-1853(-)
MNTYPLATLGRNLLFLSPRSWLGVYNALHNQITDSDVLFQSLGEWFRSMLLHFLLLMLAIHNPSNIISSSTISNGNLLSKFRSSSSIWRASLATCISPMVIAQTVEIIPHTRTIANRLRLWKVLRQEADDDAFMAISSGVAEGRVVRCAHADFYFPKRVTCEGAQKAVLFIPGMCIDHTAYARIASRIASEGNVIVVVICLEPFRIADKHFVDMSELRKCMNTAEKLWNKRCGTDGSKLEWCLGGHSYGGYAALRLASSLGRFLHKSCNDKLKIVVWAAGDRKQFLTDLSLRDELDILVLYGSRDEVCDLNQDKVLRQLKSYLPNDVKFECIDGANHNNFASYKGIMSQEFISRKSQHFEVMDKTLCFLHDDASEI